MAGRPGGLQVALVKSSSTGKLFSSEQTPPVAASCSSAPAEDSRGWPFSPAWAGQKDLSLSRGVFRDVLLLILPPASLQVKEWGQCRHPEHCPFLCSPVAQGRVLWQGCTSQRMGGWQEGWSENSVTHTSFASWMHLQQFILLVSYWSDQCLSVCPLLKDRASSTPQSSQF